MVTEHVGIHFYFSLYFILLSSNWHINCLNYTNIYYPIIQFKYDEEYNIPSTILLSVNDKTKKLLNYTSIDYKLN